MGLLPKEQGVRQVPSPSGERELEAEREENPFYSEVGRMLCAQIHG